VTPHADKLPSPAIVLRDLLAERGMSQLELSRQLGGSDNQVNLILRGRRGITPRLALRLQEALGFPALYWLILETTYRLEKAKGP